MANLCVGEDFSEELTCAVCLDSWKDPVELSPCGHIFCKACVDGLKECPVCRDRITTTKTPNRTLVNMALQISVKCMRCGWKGKREQGMSHVCGSTGGNAAAAPAQSAARPTTLTPPVPPQHPSAVSIPSPYTYNPAQQPPFSGYPTRPTAQSSNVDLWQSGAPTSAPPQPQPYQQQQQQSSGYTPGYSGQPYPGAAPVPSGSSAGYQTGYPPTNSGGYGGGPSTGASGGGYGQPHSQPSQTRYRVIEPTGPRPWTLYGLGQEEYDQIVSLFVFFDEDESGALDRKEVARLARWLNFATTPQDVDRIFNDMDADRSGSLSLGEFLTWLRHNKPNPQALYGLTQSQYNTIMMQFHTYDTNQDGCLEMNEFTRLVLNLRDMPNEAAAQRLFQMIDRDRDGAISLHEFLTFRAGKG